MVPQMPDPVRVRISPRVAIPRNPLMWCPEPGCPYGGSLPRHDDPAVQARIRSVHLKVDVESRVHTLAGTVEITVIIPCEHRTLLGAGGCFWAWGAEYLCRQPSIHMGPDIAYSVTANPVYRLMRQETDSNGGRLTYRLTGADMGCAIQCLRCQRSLAGTVTVGSGLSRLILPDTMDHSPLLAYGRRLTRHFTTAYSGAGRRPVIPVPSHLEEAYEHRGE